MNQTEARQEKRRALRRTAVIATLGYGLGVGLALLVAAPDRSANAITSPRSSVRHETTPSAAPTLSTSEDLLRAALKKARTRGATAKRLRVPAEGQAVRRMLDEPVFHPRPESEWQGMLVDVSTQSSCESIDGCGLAMACLGGTQCGPCDRDSDCAGGEACVLDHCVQQSKVECRSESQCGADEVCVLSGYSDGIRGNEDMSARCQPTAGGIESPEIEELIALADEPSSADFLPRPVSVADLRSSLSD